MSQKKYPRPRLRGEVWITWDDREVTILKHLAHDCVEVLNDRGDLEALYENQFRKRLKPPVTEEE